MGYTTTKIGSRILIKSADIEASVTNISGGRYYTDSDEHPGPFYPNEIKTIPTRPAPPEKKTPIARETKPKQRSEKKGLYDAIYAIVSSEYKKDKDKCMAGLFGCIGKGSEIHHKYRRDNYWLICSKHFLYICPSCHRYITENSDEAIERGLSISRMSKLTPEFTEREKQLINQFKLRLPFNI